MVRLRISPPQKRKANCVACDAWVEGDPCAAVYLETTRQIREGEELLFDCARI